MTSAESELTGKTVILTGIAMIAFAANSILCRQALGPGAIDAASFATVRVISGAVALTILGHLHLAATGSPRPARTALLADARTIIALFTYMVFFAFAYRYLSAGTGALILFGAVQLTMFAFALRSGEHFTVLSWCGLSLAVGGLVYLVSPGVTAPDPLGAVLMAVAGVAWGFYSLWGRGAADPLRATARNFTGCVILVAATSLAFAGSFHVTMQGAVLAAISGAVTSGCGYAVWYAALRGLSGTRAATVQLSVPAIASIGGVLFLSEDVTMRLVGATAATLGGVAIVLAQRRRKAS